MQDLYIAKESSMNYSTWLATGTYPNTRPVLDRRGKRRGKRQRHSNDWEINNLKSVFKRKSRDRYYLKVLFHRPLKS